jgi:serine/threonine-protein kinase
MAWTRNSPRQQRVEAAALRGRPVFFALIEPWTKPDRTPGADNSNADTIIVSVLGGLLVVVLTAAAWLATGNLRRRRGDGRGAFRLAAFTFCVQMLLWAARAHIGMTLGTFGIFLVALATSVFYGAAMWLLYIALEPYVRRRWPQTLISWSALLIGRLRDPVVGRDVLIGCTGGALLAVLNGLSETWLRRAGGWPNMETTLPLLGARGSLAMVLLAVPHAIRGALFFFFLIFLLRAVLRNQWAAGGAFALILASLSLLDSGHPVFRASINFIVFIGLAFIVLRWGLLALGISLLFLSVSEVPAPQISAWYFSGSACVLIAALALVAWAFHTSIGARKIWNHDFF